MRRIKIIQYLLLAKCFWALVNVALMSMLNINFSKMVHPLYNLYIYSIGMYNTCCFFFSSIFCVRLFFIFLLVDCTILYYVRAVSCMCVLCKQYAHIYQRPTLSSNSFYFHWQFILESLTTDDSMHSPCSYTSICCTEFSDH